MCLPYRAVVRGVESWSITPPDAKPQACVPDQAARVTAFRAADARPGCVIGLKITRRSPLCKLSDRAPTPSDER